MNIKIDISNYHGDAQKKINYIKSGPPLAVFTESFMRANTDFKHITDFIKASTCTSDNIVDALNDDAYSSFIREHTQFSSWEEMYNAAVQYAFDN